MLIPNWPIPANVKAVCFDKRDMIDDCTRYLPAHLKRLTQVHGNRVIDLATDLDFTADGSYSNVPGQICAIYTADCLPIYLASTSQTEVALLHGGWRGLSLNIIQAGLQRFRSPPQDIMAYLGPAISARHYEVGVEVYEAFCGEEPALASAFSANRPGHYYCDLPHIARYQLQQGGVRAIYGGDHCTFTNTDYYSVRREGHQQTGRLLHCLWLEERD